MLRAWVAMVVVMSSAVLAVPQCEHHYGGCRSFLPAPPGQRPPCASAGATFCEAPDHYPGHLIQYLIERWGYDFSSLLTDESRAEYKSPRPPPPYHPHHYSPGTTKVPSHLYHYQRPPHAQYGPPASNASAAPFAGYPDRRYKLDFPLVYTAVVPAPYSSDWWTRLSRSVDPSAKDTPRGKRQAANVQKLCPTNAQYVMPKAAMNNRGNWMYVVNLSEVSDRYTQLVRSETCVSSTCSGLCSLPNGYASSCEQQFVQKRLVALEGSGERLYTDVFWFPHCCVCQITQTAV